MISTPLHLLGVKKAECKLLDLYSYSFFFFVLKLVTPKALGGGKKIMKVLIPDKNVILEFLFVISCVVLMGCFGKVAS